MHNSNMRIRFVDPAKPVPTRFMNGAVCEGVQVLVGSPVGDG